VDFFKKFGIIFSLVIAMKRKKYNWTAKDDQFLIENWDVMSIYQMKKTLGCSWELVASKAEKLGFEVPTNNDWSEEEKELLVMLADEYHYREIANMMNRSEQAIYLKARKMGVVLIQDRRKWTLEEEQQLRDNWGKYSIESLAKKMKRTVFSIKVKAMRMQLGPLLDGDLASLSVSDLVDIFNVSREIILETWQNHGLKIKAKRLTQKYHCYVVKINDLWQFLEENQGLWCSLQLEKNILGEEPEWLAKKREQDVENPIMNYRVWTVEEIRLARNLLEIGFNYEQIAERLNRSPDAVGFKIREIGLSYTINCYWQDNEEEIVRKEYLEKTAEELSEIINRSPRAIREKARCMGIQKKLIRRVE